MSREKKHMERIEVKEPESENGQGKFFAKKEIIISFLKLINSSLPDNKNASWDTIIEALTVKRMETLVKRATVGILR